MPEMDGYEVCRRLRAKDRSKDVPVIFLSALTDTADKVRAFDAGGVDYVTKPFQFEEVLARVKTHVALRRAQAELADSYTPPSRPGTAARRPRAHGRPRHAVAAAGAAHQPPALEACVRRAQRRRAARSCRHAIRVDRSAQPDDQRPARREPARRVQDAGQAGGVGSDADGPRRAFGDGGHWCRANDRHRQRGARGSELRRRTRPAGDGELRQQRHQAHARRQPDAHFHRQRRGPRASRRARRGTRRALRKRERGSSRSSGPSRLDRNRTITPPGWVSRSASSPSRPMAGRSAWIRVCRPAARSGSSCPRDGGYDPDRFDHRPLQSRAEDRLWRDGRACISSRTRSSIDASRSRSCPPTSPPTLPGCARLHPGSATLAALDHPNIVTVHYGSKERPSGLYCPDDGTTWTGKDLGGARSASRASTVSDILRRGHPD